MQSWIRGQEQWQPSLWMNCSAISLYQNSCIQTRKDNSSPTWLRSVVYWRFTRHAQRPTNPNVSLVEHFNWTLKHVVNHLERPSLWLGTTTKEGMHSLQLKYTCTCIHRLFSTPPSVWVWGEASTWFHVWKGKAPSTVSAGVCSWPTTASSGCPSGSLSATAIHPCTSERVLTMTVRYMKTR